MGGETGISRALQSSVRNTRSWRNKKKEKKKKSKIYKEEGRRQHSEKLGPDPVLVVRGQCGDRQG